MLGTVCTPTGLPRVGYSVQGVHLCSRTVTHKAGHVLVQNLLMCELGLCSDLVWEEKEASKPGTPHDLLLPS